MDIKSTLMHSFEEILDKMAFLFFEEGQPDTPPEQFDYISHVDFKGVINGTLHLFFTHATGEELARNLIGIRDDDELYKGTVEDAVCEFTNMIMGRTMTELNPDERFELTVPVIVQEPSWPGDGDTSVRVDGMLEDEPCRIVMHYRER